MNEKLLNKIKSSATELNLSDLFWHIVSKWRVLLIGGLILGLLLGGAELKDSFSKLKDEDYVRGIEESNAHQERLYTIAMEHFESRIDWLRGEIRQHEQFAGQAAIMALDPYRVYVGEGLYYIELRPDGAEGESGADALAAVVGAYAAQIEGLDAGEILTAAGALLPEQSADNYAGFLRVSADPEGGSLRYKAYGATAEQAEALSAAVDAAVRDSGAAIRAGVCGHSVSLLSESLSLRSDEELLQLHSSFDEEMAAITLGLSEVIELRDKTLPPVLTSVSRSSAVKATVKKAVIGFAAGLVLCGMAFAVDFIAKGILADPDDLTDRYGVSVLGVIPSGRKRTGVDSHVARHFGLPLGMSMEDGLRFSCVNLAAVAKGRRCVLISGSGEKAAVQALCEKLREQMPELQLCGVGSILRDPEARKAFNETDALVFVETLQQARHAEIRRELIQTLEADKHCLGFLLVEKGVV